MEDMDFILRSMKYPALKRVIENYAREATFKEKWRDIFGQLASQLVFLWVQKEVLAVGTTNPLWQTEIRHYQSKILMKIKTHCPSLGEIKEIKVFFLSSAEDKERFFPGDI